METVLVVERDPGNSRILQTVLVNIGGYEVVVVEDGAKAVEKIKWHCPDVVLLDLPLLNADGSKVLEEVISLRPALPVIVAVDPAEELTAVRAVQKGAQDYLIRPFENIELWMKVRRALKKAQGSRENLGLATTFEEQGGRYVDH